MKVILLQDVKALGRKGEIVEVNEGYARNFIVPKKLGVEANAKNLNDLKLQNANAEKVAAERLAEAQALAARIEKVRLVVSIKSGKDGRTFGSISSKELAQELKKQASLDIDKKKIELSEPIRALGGYEVGVKLHKDVTAKLFVKVEEAK